MTGNLCSSLLLGLAVCIAGGVARADTPQIQNHGIAVPVSISRGSFVVRAQGEKEKVLVNLLDHSGGYGILMVDPETGKSDFFAYPFKANTGPFYSLYSRKGLFYGLFGGYFFEFDPRKGEFTFHEKVADDLAMSITEADDGTVWVGVYPKAHLIAFNPETRTLKDHGPVNNEDWPQYPRLVAVDDVGWVYAFIGFTRHQIVAFNPADGTVIPLIAEADRVGGGASIGNRTATHTINPNGTLWRGTDGKVYARSPGKDSRDWYVLHAGKMKRTTNAPTVERVEEFADHQGAQFHRFADGREVQSLDMTGRELAVIAPDSRLRRVKFDYPGKGAFVYSLALGPDGRIYGSSGHPLHLFSYYIERGEMSHSKPITRNGHMNALATVGDSVYGAIYTEGSLVKYTPQAQNDTPDHLRFSVLTSAGQDILRPFHLLPHSDGRHLVMVGSPGYGRTGGGMLFYDVETGERSLIRHTELIENHSTKALAVLPDGNLIGGTTIDAGTGGRVLADTGELYIFDWKDKKVLFREAILPGHSQYRELMPVGDDLVIGLASEGGVRDGAVRHGAGATFFVFNWKTKKLLSSEKLEPLYGRIAGGQAPRVWYTGEDGMIYCLFKKALVRIDPQNLTHEKVADIPVDVFVGVVIANGRIYFSSASQLYSLSLPYAGKTTTATDASAKSPASVPARPPAK